MFDDASSFDVTEICFIRLGMAAPTNDLVNQISHLLALLHCLDPGQAQCVLAQCIVGVVGNVGPTYNRVLKAFKFVVIV